MRKRSKRRNADDNIRKLHRKSLSGDIEDVVAYWTACLRAGQVPEPTYIDPTGQLRSGAHALMPVGADPSVPDNWVNSPLEWWRVEYESPYGREQYVVQRYQSMVKKNLYAEYGPQVLGWRVGWGRRRWDDRFPNLPIDSHHTKAEADSYVKARLADFVSWWTAEHPEAPKKNPIRRNADDKLRKLERASHEGPVAKAAYWRALLQAGRIPEPTKDETKNGRRSRFWLLNVHPGLNCLVSLYTGSRKHWEDEDSIYLLCKGNYAEATKAFGEDVEKLLPKYLMALLDEYDQVRVENPPGRRPRAKRSNADDRLRKLERAAKAPGASDMDKAAYWRASLQAGIIPEPVQTQIGGGHTIRRIWVLGQKAEVYRPFYPRVILHTTMTGQPTQITRWDNTIKDSYDKGFIGREDALAVLRQELLKYVDDFEVLGSSWRRYEEET